MSNKPGSDEGSENALSKSLQFTNKVSEDGPAGNNSPASRFSLNSPSRPFENSAPKSNESA